MKLNNKVMLIAILLLTSLATNAQKKEKPSNHGQLKSSEAHHTNQQRKNGKIEDRQAKAFDKVTPDEKRMKREQRKELKRTTKLMRKNAKTTEKNSRN